MQKVDKLIIGQRHPHVAPGIEFQCVGTMEVRDDDWLQAQAYMPMIMSAEIEAFKKVDIKVSYYGNSSNGKNAIYFKTGVGVFEYTFNPNLYKDDRMQGFIKSDKPTILFMELIDSATMVLKAIRVVEMPDRVIHSIKGMWKAAMDTQITEDEYNQWVDQEVSNKPMEVLLKNTRSIGVIRGGATPEGTVFLGEL